MFVAGEGDLAGDRFEDAFGVSQDLVVPEADDAVAVGLDGGGSRSVVLGVVLPTVAFNRQAERPAGEVHNMIADRKLPGEFRAERPRTQVRPQAPLGMGHLAAQLARGFGQSLSCHLSLAPTPTLPRTGEGVGDPS